MRVAGGRVDSPFESVFGSRSATLLDKEELDDEEPNDELLKAARQIIEGPQVAVQMLLASGEPATIPPLGTWMSQLGNQGELRPYAWWAQRRQQRKRFVPWYQLDQVEQRRVVLLEALTAAVSDSVECAQCALAYSLHLPLVDLLAPGLHSKRVVLLAIESLAALAWSAGAVSARHEHFPTKDVEGIEPFDSPSLLPFVCRQLHAAALSSTTP